MEAPNARPGTRLTAHSAPKSRANAAPLTPVDGQDLPNCVRALWIGGAGTISVVHRNGDENSPVTYNVGVSTDKPLPFYIKRLLLTGTTATNIIGLW